MLETRLSEKRGLFIAFEGIDGSGTTTQARLLVAWLIANSEAAHLTREPSDGPIGTLIRHIMDGNETVPAKSIALLFAGDRLDHLEREIFTNVDEGIHVISDRYLHSSLAYQSVESDGEWISEINEFAVMPDVVVFLDVEPEVGLKRIADRSQQQIYEKQGFLSNVTANYRKHLTPLRQLPFKLIHIEGDQQLETVQEHIRKEIMLLLRG